jgi:uncharacterized protein DUF3597
VSVGQRSLSMSIFGSIMSKVFGNHGTAAANANAPPASSTTTAPSAQASTSPSGTSVAPSAAPLQLVDVEGVLTDLASKNSQQLNWRTSIVDLMKLVDLDSSLNARKELASELHYTGDMNDSASMNIWLHKQVMQKLAENGGKVPDDLKA